MRSPAGRAVVRNTSAIFQELSQLEKTGLSHLASQSFGDLLINLTIASMHPELFGEEEGRLAASSSAVAKAEEIIRTRAHEPLAIRDVAVEVGVTVRSLQIGFGASSASRRCSCCIAGSFWRASVSSTRSSAATCSSSP